MRSFENSLISCDLASLYLYLTNILHALIFLNNVLILYLKNVKPILCRYHSAHCALFCGCSLTNSELCLLPAMTCNLLALLFISKTQVRPFDLNTLVRYNYCSRSCKILQSQVSVVCMHYIISCLFTGAHFGTLLEYWKYILYTAVLILLLCIYSCFYVYYMYKSLFLKVTYIYLHSFVFNTTYYNTVWPHNKCAPSFSVRSISPEFLRILLCCRWSVLALVIMSYYPATILIKTATKIILYNNAKTHLSPIKASVVSLMMRGIHIYCSFSLYRRLLQWFSNKYIGFSNVHCLPISAVRKDMIVFRFSIYYIYHKAIIPMLILIHYFVNIISSFRILLYGEW